MDLTIHAHPGLLIALALIANGARLFWRYGR